MNLIIVEYLLIISKFLCNHHNRKKNNIKAKSPSSHFIKLVRRLEELNANKVYVFPVFRVGLNLIPNINI